MRNGPGWLRLVLATAMVIVGCAGPTPTPSVERERNCWREPAYAWHDSDRDGVWDEDEAGLPGVVYALSGPGIDVSGRTDDEGRVTLGDCWTLRLVDGVAQGPDPEYNLTLEATAPEGYRFTTKSQLDVYRDELRVGLVREASQ
jgi:hypothetical protein